MNKVKLGLKDLENVNGGVIYDYTGGKEDSVVVKENRDNYIRISMTDLERIMILNGLFDSIDSELICGTFFSIYENPVSMGKYESFEALLSNDRKNGVSAATMFEDKVYRP